MCYDVTMCYDVVRCVTMCKSVFQMAGDVVRGGDECPQGMGTANEGLARTELNGIFDWYDNDETWGRENGV